MWQESWEPGSNDSTLATNFQHIFTFYRSTRIAPVRWPRLCKELITSRSCFRFPIISMNRSFPHPFAAILLRKSAAMKRVVARITDGYEGVIFSFPRTSVFEILCQCRV